MGAPAQHENHLQSRFDEVQEHRMLSRSISLRTHNSLTYFTVICVSKQGSQGDASEAA